jgi:hypothetical protein
MAEYINIRGQNIEVVASDPANPTIGQIWYNSTSNTLKAFNLTTTGAWATGGSLPAAIQNLAGAGTQTAGLSIGGVTPPAPTGRVATSYEYDGSAWASGGNLATARNYLAGCGVQTAALAITGSPQPGSPKVATEEYNGATWTAGGNTANARNFSTGTGTQTAGLVWGGANGAPASTDNRRI